MSMATGYHLRNNVINFAIFFRPACRGCVLVYVNMTTYEWIAQNGP